MICPNCDSLVREGEALIIGPTKKDGFFNVAHIRLKGSRLIRPEEICKNSWYNCLSIDVTKDQA